MSKTIFQLHTGFPTDSLLIQPRKSFRCSMKTATKRWLAECQRQWRNKPVCNIQLYFSLIYAPEKFQRSVLKESHKPRSELEQMKRVISSAGTLNIFLISLPVENSDRDRNRTWESKGRGYWQHAVVCLLFSSPLIRGGCTRALLWMMRLKVDCASCCLICT